MLLRFVELGEERSEDNAYEPVPTLDGNDSLSSEERAIRSCIELTEDTSVITGEAAISGYDGGARYGELVLVGVIKACTAASDARSDSNELTSKCKMRENSTICEILYGPKSDANGIYEVTSSIANKRISSLGPDVIGELWDVIGDDELDESDDELIKDSNVMEADWNCEDACEFELPYSLDTADEFDGCATAVEADSIEVGGNVYDTENVPSSELISCMVCELPELCSWLNCPESCSVAAGLICVNGALVLL